MKKNLIFLASAALLCGVSLTAQEHKDYNWDKPGVTTQVECRISGLEEPKVAIDPILKGDKAPKNCTIRNVNPSMGSATKEEDRAFWLFVLTPKMKENEWITATFSFKVRSRRKGRVRFMIQGYGNWTHTGKELRDLPFFGIAQISSPQVSFPNGGYFGNLNLKPWGFRGKFPDKHMNPTIGTDDELNTPGKKYLKTCNALVQYIEVKPGQEITISFTVKPFEYYKPLH